MPIQEPHLGEGIVTFDVDATLLDGDRLPLCILQVGKVSDGAIDADAPRPAVVAAIRDLVVGRAGVRDHSVLDELLDGGVPTVILGPEYALGSGDWREVDELVRSADRRLLLVVGFGMTRAAWLREWAAPAGRAGPTRRWPGWDERHERLLGDWRHNGLWCWVHDPDRGTHCVTALKNFPEQRHEARAADFRPGRSIVHLRFRDADVFPLICADLLQDGQAGASTPRSRVAAAVGEGNRPVLVTGSLFQDVPWDANWQRAIGEFVNNVAPGRVAILALANQARAQPSRGEDEDRWRSLSGVFASHSLHPRGATPFPGCRSVSVGGFSSGLVVRHDGSCVAGGQVLIPRPVPTVGMHLWTVGGCLPIDDDGIGDAPAHNKHVASYELHRLTRRYPHEDRFSPRVQAGLALLRAHIEGASGAVAEDIVRHTLAGTDPSASPVDCDALHGTLPELVDGLHALASLSTLDGLAWHGGRGTVGQLLHEPSGARVLVWKDRANVGSAMTRFLQDWARSGEEHPHLVVIGSGMSGSPLRGGPLVLDRRSDVTAPPAGGDDLSLPGSPSDEARNILLPRARRSVHCINLADLCDVLYLDYVPSEDETRVRELLRTLAVALRLEAA